MLLNCGVGEDSARRSNQSILKEISPGCSLEGLMLKLKFQYFGHLMWRADSFEKTLMLGKIWGHEEKGTTEDKMVGWHHRLDGHGFGWTSGVGDGQGGLVCCGSWGCKELDMTERLNWLTECKISKYYYLTNKQNQNSSATQLEAHKTLDTRASQPGYEAWLLYFVILGKFLTFLF